MGNWIPVLLALSSGLIGFLLHSIFFSQANTIESLLESNRALRDDLRAKENEHRDTRSEILFLNKRIRLLEQQVQQRNSELSDIYQGELLRDEKIALLEKTVKEMIQNESEKRLQSEASPGYPEVSQSAQPTRSATVIRTAQGLQSLRQNRRSSDEREVPLWRKELDSVLNILDSIGK